MVAPSSHLRKGSKCEGRNFDFELSAEYLKERGITVYESQSKIIVPTFDVKKTRNVVPEHRDKGRSLLNIRLVLSNIKI